MKIKDFHRTSQKLKVMSFANIVGHKEQIVYLKNILETSKISATYLFTGPEGIGKKLVALNFAKSVNCIASTEKPCDACASCKKIEHKNHPDFFMLSPEQKGSTIKIDDIRDLRRESSLKPYESKYKIFIIDNAEALTHEAQNALLKTLEEVPPRSVFILVTSTLGRILPTIQSRARILKFNSEPLRLKERDAIERKNKVIDSIINSGLMWDYDKKRPELKEDLAIVLSWFRDILIFKTSKNKDLLFNADRINDIKKEANKISCDDLERIINKLVMLNSYIDMNVNTKLVIDSFVSELDSLKETSKG